MYAIGKLNEFKNEQEDFVVETDIFRTAKDILNKKFIVIFTGHPGEGKSTMAFKLALANDHEIRRCLLLKCPKEWNAVDWSLKIFDTIIIDDIFGTSSLDQTSLADWKPVLPEIEQAAKQKRLRAIITTRHYILEECRDQLDRFSIFKTAQEEGTAILLSSRDLNETSRKEILKFVAKKNGVSLADDQLNEFTKTSFNSVSADNREKRENFAFGFPECANMFTRNRDLFKLKAEFFKNPNALLKKYLEDLCKGQKENRDKFLALVALWSSNGNSVNEKDLQNAAKASDHLKYVVQTYYGTQLDELMLDKIQKSLDSHK